MISETIPHPSNMPMVIVENASVALSRTAVVHHNKLPPMPFHRGAPDRIDHRTCQIAIAGRATPGPETATWRWGRRRVEALVLLDAGFFDHNLGLSGS